MNDPVHYNLDRLKGAICSSILLGLGLGLHLLLALSPVWLVTTGKVRSPMGTKSAPAVGGGASELLALAPSLWKMDLVILPRTSPWFGGDGGWLGGGG